MSVSDPITGEFLATQIRRTAGRQSVPLVDFLSPMSPSPLRWLNQLAQAKLPKAHTIERVNALLAGAPVPPPPVNNFQRFPRKPGWGAVERRSIIENAPQPDVREPCFACGVRAEQHQEFGCRRWLPR